MNIIEIILKEIKTCGKTRYRIAQDTGVSEVQLHRLVNGGTLQAETVGILLKYFGYRLVKKKGGKRK
jgi:plasmid maintenance system antidote protein VapI